MGTTIKALISEAFYSASTKERKVIFEKAKRVIRDRPGDINDPMVKAMCRCEERPRRNVKKPE